MLHLNFTNTLINLYLIITFSLFTYTMYTKSQNSDNYFSAFLQILENPMLKLLIYNLIIAFTTIFYKINIKLFYEEIKQNQTLNMIQKIGYKLFELCYFLYIIGVGFGLQTFVSLTIVFVMFIFHNIAIARTNFLINSHDHQHMSLNYRLLAHFLIMLFVDYQLISHSFYWLFSQASDASYILFAYYCITISMSIIEPALSFFIHFYQVYTNCSIQNSDINMVWLKFIINIPRLIIQLLLSIIIAYQFTLSFLMIFTLIESISQISKNIKNYNSMKDLIDKMKNLKQIGHAELEQLHDRVCTVCFIDIATTGLILPCKHIFHKQCLRQWIIKNSNHHCPKCKKSFDFEKNKTSQLEQQIKKAQQRIRQRNIQQERRDPLGFEKDRNKQQYFKPNNRIYRNSPSDQRLQLGQDQYYGEQNRQILKIDQNNHLSRLQATKRIKKQKPKSYNVGSVPFGLPTQAIYQRRSKDIAERDRIIFINDKMIKFMKMDPAKQLLFVPEFQ